MNADNTDGWSSLRISTLASFTIVTSTAVSALSSFACGYNRLRPSIVSSNIPKEHSVVVIDEARVRVTSKP